MMGKFTEKDPERCTHYAKFLSHLTLAEANTVFRLLFVIVSLLQQRNILQTNTRSLMFSSMVETS